MVRRMKRGNRHIPDAIFGSVPEFMYWRNVPPKKQPQPVVSVAFCHPPEIDTDFIPGLNRNASPVPFHGLGNRMERLIKEANRNRLRLRRRYRERIRRQNNEPGKLIRFTEESITNHQSHQRIKTSIFSVVPATPICSKYPRVVQKEKCGNIKAKFEIVSRKLRSAAAGACGKPMESVDEIINRLDEPYDRSRTDSLRTEAPLIPRRSQHLGGGKSLGDDQNGDRSLVYESRHAALTHREAFNLLCAPDDAKMSIRPPFRPPGGHIYMYHAAKSRDYIADGYNWSRKTGTHRYPVNSPVVIKRTKNIITDEEPIYGDGRFKIHIYKLTTEPSPLLVHYVGDEKIFKSRPHGNEQKNPAKEYFPTAPSVRETVKSINDQPAELVYEAMKSKASARTHPAFCPRDLKQVQNLQCSSRRENRLSHDPLYEVYLLGFEYPHFIREYRTSFEFENNIIFLTSQPLLEKVNKLLNPPPNVNKKLMEFYYDTTFGIGDFFVSVLSFRHYMLQGEPVIPCAFFIHQRRFEDDHLAFLRLVKDTCPNLASQPFAFITDREFRDISSVFPEARHFFCWKHLRDDIRWWLIRHPASACQRKDRSRSYINDIDSLLHSSTIEEYNGLCNGFKNQWADSFIAYFDKHLDQDLRQKLCLFAVCDSGLVVEDRWLGITSNAAESFNAVLKRAVKNSKFEHQNFYGKVKVTLAECVLICYNLTKHFIYEIETGMCGIGKTPIKAELLRYKENLLDLGNPDPPIPLDQIFGFIKNQISSLELPPLDTVGNECGRREINATCSGLLDDSTEAHASKANQSMIFDVMKEKKNLDVRPEQQARAKELCQRGKVTVVAQRGVFVVENMEGRKYCVALFPKESCSCISESTCYHIIAARMAVGISDLKSKGRKNANNLFKLSRKRQDRKKVGGKKPKRRDCNKRAPKRLDETVPGGNLDGNPEPFNGSDSLHSENQASRSDQGSHPSAAADELGGRQAADVEDNHNSETVFTKDDAKSEPAKDEELTNGEPAEDEPGLKKKKRKVPIVVDENSGPPPRKKVDPQKVDSETGPTPAQSRRVLNEAMNHLHCTCLKPYDKRRKMAECAKCKAWFHQSCLSIPKDVFEDESVYWECESCWKAGVLKLGGISVDGSKLVTMSNTCPMDSFFTIIHSYEKDRKGFLSGITGEGTAEAVLKDCLELFRAGEYDSGKHRWINFIKGKAPVPSSNDHVSVTYNTYGCIDRYILDFFRHIWSIVQVDTCSNSGCSIKERTYHLDAFMLDPSHKRGGVFDISKCLGLSVSEKGIVCKERVTSGRICSSKRVRVEGTFAHEYPFMLPIDLDKIASFIEITKLPLTLHFNKFRFNLGGVIVNQPRVHFEIMVPRRGVWFHCDGYQNFKKTTKADLEKLGDRLVLSKAIYLLDV